MSQPYLILDDPEGVIGIEDATSESAAWAAFQAENPGYDGHPDDHDVTVARVSVGWCNDMVDGLCKARDEAARLKAHNERLRAAAPRLEWRKGDCVNWYLCVVIQSATWNAAEIRSITNTLRGPYFVTFLTVSPTSRHPRKQSEAVTIVAEWCAVNLPGIHLPPFPGTDK